MQHIITHEIDVIMHETVDGTMFMHGFEDVCVC